MSLITSLKYREVRRAKLFSILLPLGSLGTGQLVSLDVQPKHIGIGKEQASGDPDPSGGRGAGTAQACLH
jgi:hypothetical protein